MKKLTLFLFTSIIYFLPSFPAFADDLSPIDIVNCVYSSKSNSFTGKKLQKVSRQNLKLESNARIEFVDSNNFNISLTEPSAISGIKFAINSGKSLIFFPFEKLAFTDSVASGGDMITDTVIGKITTEPYLLQKNYIIRKKGDDEVATIPTYVIDIQPLFKRSDGYWGVPARTFWVSKDNFQILREDRYWAEGIEVFFSSQYIDYKSFSYLDSPNVRLKIPYDTKKVWLGSIIDKSETFLESFKTSEEAEKKLNIKVSVPKYLPPGFRLREIEVLNFFDTKLFVEKFDDGLNSIFITYRTKPNFFLTLLAGNFSLNLLHKMSDLSYHAPYNYFSRETKENLVISFGDLYPDELQKVSESLNVN